MKQQSFLDDNDESKLPPVSSEIFHDWGESSEYFDEIKEFVDERLLYEENEAQTRFDVIDRVIKSVLGWKHGQITVEEPTEGNKYGYLDYILRTGDLQIIIEAKRIGVAFPNPTRRRKLKLTGSVLGEGAIKAAIDQADYYARDKNADMLIVTNGMCWIYYDPQNRDDDTFASLLFPFNRAGDAEKLFNYFSERSVTKGSLNEITNTLPIVERRLINVVDNADGRVDRNLIADYITEALNKALFKNAIVSDYESLQRCFVTTEARARYDNNLQMYISDIKPAKISPATKIDRSKSPSQLSTIIDHSTPNQSPPVTLIIGAVGVGKTTYIKHFELIAGQQVLTEKDVHWVYIDFSKMGIGQSPRKFIYTNLINYLESPQVSDRTGWKELIEPAYEDTIEALKRGQYYQYFLRDKDKFWEKISERIENDRQALEPYVNRLFKYMSSNHLCFIILDNVDLFENDSLETEVFSEGLAFSENTNSHVIISIRDTTFVRHQSDATFDAYQLRKLWLKPPDFKEVLSARLTYSKKILENKSARIPARNGMYIDVPDLSQFFEIVHRSLLSQESGDLIEYMSNWNIRKGLELVHDFLTSGHINSDLAIKSYLSGEINYEFKFHEVFKGAILGQWRYFQENKSRHCLNIFDARLQSNQLRLLRLQIVQYLWQKARSGQEGSSIEQCYSLFSQIGASQNHVLNCLKDLEKFGLIHSVSAEKISSAGNIALTLTGGYYLQVLLPKLVYLEACVYDTSIDNEDTWHELIGLTESILIQKKDRYERMKDRGKRINIFLHYLESLESDSLKNLENAQDLMIIPTLRPKFNSQMNNLFNSMKRNRN